MCDDLIGGIIGGLCGGLCEALGPCLTGLAECMFKLVSVGCSQMIKLACYCSFWNSLGSSHGFDGCFYIALALISASIIIATLAMGIYALAQYVQDSDPAVAAGVACALLDQTLTGLSFSALPTTFGRNKGMNVPTAVPLSNFFITVYNRCFNNNKGSAKFYVDGTLAAYTKIDQNLYSCNGTITHQFEYSSTLRILNADNSLFASTDKVPTTSATTTFRDSSNVAVATLAPRATGSGFDIRILQSSSPAARPLVLLAAAAFAQFTSSGNDECNGFVLAGGIIDIILLSLLVAYAAYAALQYYRKRGSITTKFYEPDHSLSKPGAHDDAVHAGAAAYGRDDWAAEEYRRRATAPDASASSAGLHAAPHHGPPPTQPPAVAFTAHNTAVLIQFEDAPSAVQSRPAAQQHVQTSVPHSPSLPTSQPYFPPAPAANPSPPSTMTYWEGQDLRNQLAPVGYMKLKRFLVINNVACGNTLLKDELITLAVIHRGRIDFSPLISEA